MTTKRVRTSIAADAAPNRKSTSQPRKRGPRPKPIVEFPEPIIIDWIDVPTFHEALSLHASRHGDTICHLHRSLIYQGESIERSTLLQWAAGKKAPGSVSSIAILAKIERRYRLPTGYFKAKIRHSRAPTGHRKLKGISPSERRRLAWHLPDDFDNRPPKERDEILEWVRTVVISGATDYRRFQAEAAKHRYAIRFSSISSRDQLTSFRLDEDDDAFDRDEVDYGLAVASVEAPRLLAREMAGLIRFKTATLTDIGFQRNGVWNEQTALQKIEHLGLLFGALAAAPNGAVDGYGVTRANLTMGLLVFPAVWDWYVQWRERRRGFYTIWEVNMLHLGLALTREGPDGSGSCLISVCNFNLLQVLSQGLTSAKRSKTGTALAIAFTSTALPARKKSRELPASTATHSSQ